MSIAATRATLEDDRAIMASMRTRGLIPSGCNIDDIIDKYIRQLDEIDQSADKGEYAFYGSVMDEAIARDVAKLMTGYENELATVMQRAHKWQQPESPHEIMAPRQVIREVPITVVKVLPGTVLYRVA